ncbi:DNA-binding transcriptional regulator, LysR family [Paracoccus homiensis]|uniref:DNA-binding transcriptional regulator, LysR family n=3 Tax=Alphaproteobacteria TaxID=28211 RepID=A0A1I0HXK7_9RHOB|nr:DNA-binding transcriptional regulator, LysR family [Paracoccus homiensis]
MLNDLKLLELFVRVARLGAIGKAGAEFGISPTSATQRIQSLETAIGARLLHRTTRSVCLTSEGERLLHHAENILESVQDAVLDVRRDDQALRGTLRVAGPASFGRKFIAPLVTRFLSCHPDLSVQLHLSDALFDIVENGFDCAIRLGDPAASSLMAQKLAPCPRILVAAPDYLARMGRPETPQDLEGRDCVIRGAMQNWRFRDGTGKLTEVKVAGRFVTNLAEAVTEAAIQGFGIARKCAWEVQEHLASGALTPIMPDYQIVPEWNIYLMRPPGRAEPPRVKAFRAFLTREMVEIPGLSPDLPPAAP